MPSPPAFCNSHNAAQPVPEPFSLNSAVSPAAASADTYVVKPGDSVWRIASRFGVPQKTLMEANGIADPTKMRAGMTLRIPSGE